MSVWTTRWLAFAVTAAALVILHPSRDVCYVAGAACFLMALRRR